MNDFESWCTTHNNLSPFDLKFREVARDSPELLDRTQFRVLDEKPDILRDTLQSWPTFVSAEKRAELGRVSIGMHRLLQSIPERIFRLDPKKLGAFYSIQPGIAELIFSPPTGAEAMLTRGDFIETASGFKCIEFNCTPNLGGWDAAIIKDLQISAPPIARFLEREDLRIRFTDPVFEMFRYVIGDLDRKGILRSGEATIAFKVGSEEIPEISGYREQFEREVRRAIVALDLDLRERVVVCSGESLVLREGRIFVGSQKIDAVLELSGTLTPPHVYRAFKVGLVGLYSGPIGLILSNKRNIALLSQHAASGAYSPAEQAFIEAHVPWTRLVAPGEVDYAGRMCSLVELVTEHREQLVLKDSDASGGQGVLLGKFASAEEWRQTLDKALAEGDWVVQEIQESLPYLYQSGDYGCSIYDMIWGPFVFGDRYGGVILRMQPKSVGGAVNLSLKATAGVVLEV